MTYILLGGGIFLSLLMPKVILALWVRYIVRLSLRAEEDPRRLPKIRQLESRSFHHSLPGFRKRVVWLTMHGFVDLMTVQERYSSLHAEYFRVFFSPEHNTYALLFSVLGQPKVVFLSAAGTFLVRTLPVPQERGLAGFEYWDQGFESADEQLEGHLLLAGRIQARGVIDPRGRPGTVSHCLRLFRERHLRGAPCDGKFAYMEYLPGSDDHIVHIAPDMSQNELFDAVAEALGTTMSIQSWEEFGFRLLEHDGPQRIVLAHEVHPGFEADPTTYLEWIARACGHNPYTLVFYAQWPN